MRKPVLTGACAALVAGLSLLSACGNPEQAIAEAEPASGEALDKHARNIAEIVDVAGNADLVQRFCKNAMAGPCPEGILDQLKDFGYVSGGTGVDMAHAFVVMLADQKDANPDYSSSDEDYLFAAYRVALGRDPDTDGATSNLRFIQDTGNRKQMLRSLLQSTEFRNQN